MDARDLGSSEEVIKWKTSNKMKKEKEAKEDYQKWKKNEAPT